MEHEKALLDLVRETCFTKPGYRDLMNFVAITDDVGKSNVLVKTMIAMISQPIDQNTRRQIVN